MLLAPPPPTPGRPPAPPPGPPPPVSRSNTGRSTGETVNIMTPELTLLTVMLSLYLGPLTQFQKLLATVCRSLVPGLASAQPPTPTCQPSQISSLETQIMPRPRAPRPLTLLARIAILIHPSIISTPLRSAQYQHRKESIFCHELWIKKIRHFEH